MSTGSPYPPQTTFNPQQAPCSQQAPYPPQVSYPQQMPQPSSMPYPPPTMYPPQNGPNFIQSSNAPQPSAPYPTDYLSQADVPPKYDEAMTNFTKDQKKY